MFCHALGPSCQKESNMSIIAASQFIEAATVNANLKASVLVFLMYKEPFSHWLHPWQCNFPIS